MPNFQIRRCFLMFVALLGHSSLVANAASITWNSATTGYPNVTQTGGQLFYTGANQWNVNDGATVNMQQQTFLGLTSANGTLDLQTTAGAAGTVNMTAFMRLGHTTGNFLGTLNILDGVAFKPTNQIRYSTNFGSNKINVIDGALDYTGAGFNFNKEGTSALRHTVGTGGSIVVPTLINSAAGFSTWAASTGNGAAGDFTLQSAVGHDLVFTQNGGNTTITTNSNNFTVNTIVTDFRSDTPVGTDGRSPGFADQGTSSFDTTQGWTWYTESSTTNDNLTIPFGVGSETIGEQEIRVGGGLELEANAFSFGWGGNGLALALRSQTFLDVVEGEARVDWDANNGNLDAYFSQDGGLTWTSLLDGVAFNVATGSLEIVFVGNDGVDSNTLLNTVEISYTNGIVPEPQSIAAWVLFGVVGVALSIRRCRQWRLLPIVVVRSDHSRGN